jgi:hypothetical protein
MPGFDHSPQQLGGMEAHIPALPVNRRQGPEGDVPPDHISGFKRPHPPCKSELAHRPGDAFHPLAQRLFTDVIERDPNAGLGTNLCDAASHQAGACDKHPFDRHHLTSRLENKFSIGSKDFWK